MNNLQQREELANRYYVMRHGHSQANAQGIIVSQPHNGLQEFGLTGHGVDQVRSRLREARYLAAETQIISSDFRRARESAAIAHDLLDCRLPVKFDPRLRERSFGAFELTSERNYQRVWREDAVDPESRYQECESASEVMCRMTAFILECEVEYEKVTILIVSHGDALQILQTAFLRQNAATHRALPPLETAEIRRLQLNSQ